MRNERCARNGEAGFTLMEVIVALVVASLLLTIVMPAAIVASARRHKAQAQLEAVNLAAAIMAEKKNAPPENEVQKGTDGRLNWTFREEPVQSDPKGYFSLNRLDVDVRNAEGRSLYHLSTRKLRALAAQ